MLKPNLFVLSLPLAPVLAVFGGEQLQNFTGQALWIAVPERCDAAVAVERTVMIFLR